MSTKDESKNSCNLLNNVNETEEQTMDVDNKNVVVDLLKNVEIAAPPDGGYGWVVITVVAICIGLSEGFVFSLGALYSDIIEFLDLRSSIYVVVCGYLLLAFACITGPFVVPFIDKFGYRPVLLFGGITTSLVLFASSFCKSIVTFTILISVFGGIGYSTINLTCYSMFSIWFNKYRPLTCAITLFGLGVGLSVFPFIMDTLVYFYGGRGCLIILAGINCHLIPLGLLIRPPSYKSYEVSQTSDSKKNHVSCEIPNITVSQSAFILSKHSIYSHTENVESGVKMKAINPSRASNVTFASNTKAFLTDVAIVNDEDATKLPIDIPSMQRSAYIAIVNKALNTNNDPDQEVVTEDNYIQSLVTLQSHTFSETASAINAKISEELSRPFLKSDILLPTSIMRDGDGFLSTENIFPNAPTNTVLTEMDVTHPCLGILQRIFDLSIWKMPSFQITISASLLMSTLTYSVTHSVKNYSNYILMERTMSSLFLMNYGIGEITVQFLMGLLTFKNKLPPMEISYFAMSIFIGFTTILVGILADTTYIIVYGFIIGFSSGFVLNLRSLIVAKYTPIHKLTSAFSWMLMTSGACMALANIISLTGTKYDNYVLTFILFGFCSFIAGILIGSLLFIYRNIKKNQKKEEQEKL